MSLVRPKQMAKALNLDKFGVFGTAMSYVLMRVSDLPESTLKPVLEEINQAIEKQDH